MKLLEATLEAIVVERPAYFDAPPQHLCLDKSYDNPTKRESVEAFGCIGHTCPIGKRPGIPGDRTDPPKRRIVERTSA